MANANSIYHSFLKATNIDRYQDNGAAEREQIIRNMYTRILLELATNRFTWKNLPRTVDPRFLELTLATKGLSVFFFDEEYGEFMALQGSTHMTPNISDEPTYLRVTGRGNYRAKTLKAVRRGATSSTTVSGEAVPIWSNYLRTPDWDIIQIYAHKLANIDRRIELNISNSGRAKAVVADENTQLTMENIVRQIDEGQPIIRIRNLDLLQNITAVDLGVDVNAIEKLHIVRVRLWNECMGLLGINNANQDKKERLVADEVEANNDQVTVTQSVNLNARRQAVDLINHRWPEKLMEREGPISVEINGQQDYGVPAPSALAVSDVTGGNGDA